MSIGDRLEASADWVEHRPWLVVAVLAASYLFFLDIPIRYFILWYDELHTYYIAQAPTLATFVEEVRNVDLNPPLLYALVRASHVLFGVSEITTRLPSAIAFFLGSMGLFVFLRRRVGALWASSAIALFWYGPFFRYATEARPYGLLLAFFAMTLVSWDSASSSTGSRRRALAGIAIGNSGMMLSHGLAPFSIMPFCAAELIRSWRDRKIDGSVWAALLLPLGWATAYIPFMQRVEAIRFPPTFQASLQKLVTFYADVIAETMPAILIALGIAFLIAVWRIRGAKPEPILNTRDWPLLAASLLPPVLLNLAMMRSRGPFWDRYGLTTAAMMYVVLTLMVARQTRLNRLAPLAATLVLLTMHVGRDVRALKVLAHSSPTVGPRVEQTEPELPFVTNSAAIFLAMDHRETPELVRRLYYLVDQKAAIQYAQTNLFEIMPIFKKYFPIRANITPYDDFASQHRRFLVFGAINRDEEWLLRKVIAEGATVKQIGTFETPYLDSNLYDVTLTR